MRISVKFVYLKLSPSLSLSRQGGVRVRSQKSEVTAFPPFLIPLSSPLPEVRSQKSEVRSDLLILNPSSLSPLEVRSQKSEVQTLHRYPARAVNESERFLWNPSRIVEHLSPAERSQRFRCPSFNLCNVLLSTQEVRSQKSEVRSQKSEVRSLKPAGSGKGAGLGASVRTGKHRAGVESGKGAGLRACVMTGKHSRGLGRAKGLDSSERTDWKT